MNAFGLLDWVIIGVYLAGTMIAGLAMRRYVGKVEHFLVAGREMDVYLGVASLAATEFGIITAMVDRFMDWTLFVPIRSRGQGLSFTARV